MQLKRTKKINLQSSKPLSSQQQQQVYNRVKLHYATHTPLSLPPR